MYIHCTCTVYTFSVYAYTHVHVHVFSTLHAGMWHWTRRWRRLGRYGGVQRNSCWFNSRRWRRCSHTHTHTHTQKCAHTHTHTHTHTFYMYNYMYMHLYDNACTCLYNMYMYSTCIYFWSGTSSVRGHTIMRFILYEWYSRRASHDWPLWFVAYPWGLLYNMYFCTFSIQWCNHSNLVACALYH